MLHLHGILTQSKTKKVVKAEHSEEISVRVMEGLGHKKVKGAGGDYGRIGEAIAKIAQDRAEKEGGRDELNVGKGRRVFSCMAVVRGCGGEEMGVCLTSDSLQFLVYYDESHNLLSPHRRATLPFPDLHQPSPTVKNRIHLTTIIEILYTETDSTTLSMDFEKRNSETASYLSMYSVLKFSDAARKDAFLGYLIKFRNDAARGLKKLTVTVVSEPLLSVEYAKRAMSLVKLRRALENQLAYVDTEDDFTGVAMNPNITQLIRSKGDTTIKLSLYVQLLSERPERPSHILLITGTSICILHDHGREYKLEGYIRVERLVNVVYSTSQSLLVLSLRPEKKQDGGILRSLRSEWPKEHSTRELLIRVMPNSNVSLHEAIHKIQIHLEKVFLDVRIERLPFRHEHQVFFPSRMDIAKQAGSKLAKFISKQRQADEVTGVARQDLYPAYKWLLVIVKERVFDLIDTFTNLNISSDTGQHHVQRNMKNKDHLIGRRLGLSLVALCAHLDLTHQLMYECILYEIMSCFGPDKNPAAIFQHDTFAITLISLYLGSKIDQFARLSLSEAAGDFKNHFGSDKSHQKPHRHEQLLEQYTYRYFKAITNPDLLPVLPYELQVIVAMIKRCVNDITEEGLVVAGGVPINVHACIGAFLMQRVWLPSIQSPRESGIICDNLTKRQTAFLAQIGGILNHAVGYGSPPDLLRDWKSKNFIQITKYFDSIIDEQMLAQSRMYTADDVDVTAVEVFVGGDRRCSAEMSINKMNSVELVRRQNVVMKTLAGDPSRGASKPRAFNKLLDKVVSIKDDDLKTHLPNLSSVHEALGRDTGRLLACLMANVAKLKKRAEDIEAAIDEIEDELTSSPYSVDTVSSMTFREASPLPSGIKRWKRALIGLQLGTSNEDRHNAGTHPGLKVDDARVMVYTAYVVVPMYGGLVLAGAMGAIVGKTEAEKFVISPELLTGLDREAERLEAELEVKLTAQQALEAEIAKLQEQLAAYAAHYEDPPPCRSPTANTPPSSPPLSATMLLHPAPAPCAVSSSYLRLGAAAYHVNPSPTSSSGYSSSDISDTELHEYLRRVDEDMSLYEPSPEARQRVEEEEEEEGEEVADDEEEEETEEAHQHKYFIRERSMESSEDESLEAEYDDAFLPNEPRHRENHQ